jgi:hypothetical protein
MLMGNCHLSNITGFRVGWEKKNTNVNTCRVCVEMLSTIRVGLNKNDINPRIRRSLGVTRITIFKKGKKEIENGD